MAEKNPGSTSTSKAENVPENVPELEIFRQHYSGLATMLFNTNLTPYLIQEGVIALTDQEELNAIATSSGKAAFVLPKITSALKTDNTESFYKILEIMKCHGNHAAQQLSDTIASEIPGPRRELLQAVTIKKMDELSLEFSALVADVAELLEQSANLNKFKLVCCHVTTTEKSLILSEKEISQIRSSGSVFDIFFLLRGHWRWDNHRLLYTLIKRTQCQDAVDKLEQFRKKVDYTKRLNEFSHHIQSVRKPPPPGYTKMRAIIDKDYSEFTVKDCTELDEYLAGSLGSTTLNPGYFESSNSIQVTWYIPTEAVSGLLGRAYQAKETFQLLSISFFEIDEVVVWNKKWPHSLQSLTENLNKKDSLIAEYSTKLTQAETELKQAVSRKDQEIKVLIAEKTKLEHDSGIGSMKDSTDQAGTSLPKESTASIEEVNKNMIIFELENSLDQQEKSFTNILNERDAELLKIQSELKVKSEVAETLKQECASLQAALDKSKAENTDAKDNQAKGQKKESIHSIKMKNKELEVEINKKDVYLTRLKDQLNEAEDKIMMLQKKTSAIESVPKESDQTASRKVDEQAKLLDSLQSKLKDLEDQNSDLQKKLQNAYEQKQTEIDNLKAENQKLKKPVSGDMGYHSGELYTLPDDAPSSSLRQPEGNVSTLLIKNSQLSTQVEQLRAEVSQMKISNSHVDSESKKLKELNKKLQNKEQQLLSDLKESNNQKLKEVKIREGMQAQITSLEEELKKPQKQWIQMIGEANSNTEAVKKEMSDQVKSYCGIIDDKESIIAKLQDDLRESKSKQLENEKAYVQVQTEISKLKAENQKLKKKPDSAYHTMEHTRELDSLLSDPPSLTQHQVMTQSFEAASNSKAIIDELNDQVKSYLGLLEESDKRIEKLVDENKRLREFDQQAAKAQVQKREKKDDKDKERAKTLRRSSVAMSAYYEESHAGIPELQQAFKRWNRGTDKDSQ